MSRKRQPSDALFRLIKSLSHEELMRIRAYARTFNRKGVQAYLQVLDLLSNSEKYNPVKLTKAFPDQQVPRLKTYTHNFLVKALRVIGDAENESILNLIAEIQISLKRQDFIRGEQLIEKAYQLCKEKEYFGFHLEVLNLHLQYVTSCLPPDKQTPLIIQIQKDQDQLFTLQRNLMDFQNLRTEFYIPAQNQHYLTGKVDPSLLTRLSASEPMKTPDYPKSIRAQVLFHIYFSFYHQYSGNLKESEESGKKLERIFNDNSWLKTEFNADYTLLMERLGYISIIKQDQELGHHYISELESIFGQSAANNHFVYDKLIGLKFAVGNALDSFRFEEDAAKFMESGAATYFGHLVPSKQIRLCFLAARYYLNSNSLENFYSWQVRWSQIKSGNLWENFNLYIRIITLMLFFEKWDTLQLESFGRNTWRYAKKLESTKDTDLLLISARPKRPDFQI